MSPELRALHLLGATGASRIEMKDGREWLVIPTVALIEGVIHPVNAKSPEFVSASVIEQAAASWNGRPITLGHPVKNGTQCSADDATILESHGIGEVRNARYSDSKLLCDSWIDVARAQKLHPVMLADLRADKAQPVSVGAFITEDGKGGAFGGKPYQTAWLSTKGDHLAFLPGGRGACSLEMGCGTHRAAMHLVTAEGFEVLGAPDGHEFYGNQHTDGTAGALAKNANAAAKKATGTNSSKELRSVATLYNTTADLYDKEGDKTKAEDSRIKADKFITRARRWELRGFQGLEEAEIERMPMTRSLRERFNDLVAGLKTAGIYDTTEQAVSEEVSELVKWQAMRATCDALGDAWDEVDTLIDELIEAEAVHAVDSGEQAEAEIEAAKLDAIRMHCMAMSGAISALISTAYPMPEVAPARYMEAFRAAYGKTISAKNMSVIQKSHDASHDMHGHTVALGAECNGMRLLTTEEPEWLTYLAKAKNCLACEGTGQVKKDDKQSDCDACDGTGALKTTTLKAAECGCKGDIMTDQEKITALEAEVASLKAATSTKDAEIKAAQDKAAETETALRAAQAAQIPAEELTQLRSLAEERKQQDAASKAALVAQLTPLKTLSKEQLEAKSLDDLKTLAAFAKVEAPVDYSGRGIAVPRQAASNNDFTPPNPYDAGIKALQSKAVN